MIESKPERVATVGWENQDTPLALGVAPVGVSAANYGLVTENNLHPWTDEAFQSLGVDSPVVFNDVDGLDYEANQRLPSGCNTWLPIPDLPRRNMKPSARLPLLSLIRKPPGRLPGKSRPLKMPLVWV